MGAVTKAGCSASLAHEGVLLVWQQHIDVQTVVAGRAERGG